MEQTVTLKLRISALKYMADTMLKTMQAYRDACNFVSGYVFSTHDLNRYSIQKNTYYMIRNLYGLRSQMAISCIRTVVGRYRTILENEKTWIKPSFKAPQLDLVWNRDYSIRWPFVSLNTLEGRYKLPFYPVKGYEQYFDKDLKYGTAKVVVRHNKIFLHIPVTFEVPDVSEEDIEHVVGVDRGINFIAATYDSEGKSSFVKGRSVKQKRAHYKELRRELQMKRTPSSRRRLKAIGQRENRWMQDVNHCVSKALVENNPKHTLFVLEDLSDVRRSTERVRKDDRYVSVSWSFYDLEQKLKYKAAMNECLVINVDPRYTSQTCPCCGHTEKANRIKRIHTFVCKRCGYTSNDDRIGAMNLCRMGTEYLAESRKSISLSGGAQSIVPDVTSVPERSGSKKVGGQSRSHYRTVTSPSASALGS